MNTPNPHKGTKSHKWTHKGGSGSNFRWSPSTSHFLLSYISQQAKLLGNPKFKRKCFSNASQAVSDRYGISVTDTNVLNHVRTIRNRYKLVRKLQALENTTWDDERKMVVMSPIDYDDHIRENPKDEPFINKRIEMYDEICVLCEDPNPTAQNLSGSDNDNDDTRDSDNESDDFLSGTGLLQPREGSTSKRRRTQGQSGTPPIPTPPPPKKAPSNFRWTPYMSRLLLAHIVEQIRLRRPKREAVASAGRLVSARTELRCSAVNVENHLRTIRRRLVRVRRLQGMEGATWDEERKMVVVDDAKYNQHIRKEPQDEPYLNKTIDMYDEMVIIFDTEWPTNHEEDRPALTDGLDQNEIYDKDDDRYLHDQYHSPQRSPFNRGGRHGNRKGRDGQSEGAKWATNKLMRDVSAKMGSLAQSIGDLASAIKGSSERGVCEELYREVMKCEGYDEVLLGKAFDYLNEHAHLGRGFLVKSRPLRQAWLSEFFSSSGLDM